MSDGQNMFNPMQRLMGRRGLSPRNFNVEGLSPETRENLVAEEISYMRGRVTAALNLDPFTPEQLQELENSLNDPSAMIVVPENSQPVFNYTQPEDDLISLNVDGSSVEKLRVAVDGFYVDGKKVVDDRKIYEAFVEWLNIGRVEAGLDKHEPVEEVIEEEPSGDFTRYSALTQKSENGE